MQWPSVLYRSNASSRRDIVHSQLPDLPIQTIVIGASGANAQKSNEKLPFADGLVTPIAGDTIVGLTSLVSGRITWPRRLITTFSTASTVVKSLPGRRGR